METGFTGNSVTVRGKLISKGEVPYLNVSQKLNWHMPKVLAKQTQAIILNRSVI